MRLRGWESEFIASGLAFLTGGLLTCELSREIAAPPLMRFGAGNCIDVCASDPVQGFTSQPRFAASLVHIACPIAGAAPFASLMYRFHA